MMLSISRLLFWIMLVFAPLAFGSVEPWALFLLTVICGAALSCYLLECRRGNLPFYRVPGQIPLLFLAVFMVLQIIPLPAGFLDFVSPETLSVWEKTAGLLTDARSWRISMDIKGTIMAMAIFSVCLGGYILAIQLLADRTMFKRTLLALACFGGLFAFFAIVQSIFTTDHALWFRYVPVSAMVFGSYVCHNHYAGLMEMLTPLTLALAVAHRPMRQFGTFKEKVIGFFEDRKTPLFLLLCFCAVIMVVSVFASLSRGGIISLCASLVVFGAGVAMNRRTRPLVAGNKGIFIFAGIILLAVSWFGWHRIDLRFGELPVLPSDEAGISRFHYWRDSTGIIADFPLAGTGLGSFETVFPAYQTFFSSDTVIAHAHNDYLELLSEGGIIAGGLFGLLFAGLFIKTRNRLKTRRERYAILICTGAASGIVAILFHGIVDFNLRITANALYFSILFALMVSAAHTRMRRGLGATYLPVCGGKTTLGALIGVLGVWLIMMVITFGVWLGETRTGFFKGKSITLNTPLPVLQKIESAAASAASVDPFEPTYALIHGDARLFAGDAEGAARAYSRALRQSPMRAEVLQKAGLAIAYSRGDMETADALMAAGVEFAPMRLSSYKQHAAFLFAAGRRAESLDVVRRAMVASPEKSRRFFRFMSDLGIKPAAMIDNLPTNATVFYRMALYVRSTGDDTLYVPLLEQAMRMDKADDPPPPGIYHHLARAYDRNNNIDAAIHVLEQGLGKYPARKPFLYELGRLYEKNNIHFKARQLYKMLYVRDPWYRDVRDRLAAMGG
ncbi:MAG: O-antigen ligase family protein [Thermodesulfobacteriota bacterium]|nr:O-antigen ligase family protein [Thermodesulfobacteriota bacterium]